MTTKNVRPRARSSELALLGHAAELEESGVPGLVRAAVVMVGVSVAAVTAWAAKAPVDEVAVVTGVVLPSGSVRIVQHLEGGIIDAILVAEGDLVEPGQPLVRLSPAIPAAELEQMQARAAALELKAARLGAVASGDEIDLAAVAPEYQDLAADHAAALEAAARAVEEQRRVILASIDQERSQLNALMAQRRPLENQLAIVREEFVMRETLYKQQLQSKIVFLETQREVTRVEGSLAELDGRIARAIDAIAEGESRLEELAARVIADAAAELEATSSELAEVRATLASLEDRVERLDVLAPVRGVVKGLAVTSVGAVVAPGAPILEVVPIDDSLVAEGRLTTQDAGLVREGQAVTVKVSAYDFARYGTIDGTVADISASTFLDEQNQPYYKMTVALARTDVGGADQSVLPGMTVQLDVRTGARTVMDYMLKPVQAALGESLQEH